MWKTLSSATHIAAETLDLGPEANLQRRERGMATALNRSTKTNPEHAQLFNAADSGHLWGFGSRESKSPNTVATLL